MMSYKHAARASIHCIVLAAVVAIWLIAPAVGEAQLVKPPPSNETLPPPSETLPPPKELVPPPKVVITSIRIIPGPEIGKRNVWELYSVNSRGQFVPRVGTNPAPVYYYYFPGPSQQNPLPAHPSYMPYAVD